MRVMQVLVASNNSVLCAQLHALCKQYGVSCVCVDGLDEVAALEAYQLVVVGPCTGVTAIAALFEAHPSLPVLAILASGEVEPLEALGVGASDFVMWPEASAGVLAARLVLVLQQAQSALAPPEREGALFLEAVESVGEIVQVSSPTGLVEYVNEAIWHVMGIAPHAAIGKELLELYAGSDLTQARFEALRDQLNQGQPWEGSLVLEHGVTGGEVVLWASVSPIFDVDDAVVHHVAIMRDVTSELESRRALEEARDRAVWAGQARNAFLANMSHELRTPLNAIIGYAELLQEELEELEPQEMAPDLEKIHGAGVHLLEMIDDILDMSSLEAGQMELEQERFDLEPLLAEVLTEARGRHPGLELVAELDGPLGEMDSDRGKLRHVIRELVSNAIKFGEGSVVHLKVRREGERVRFGVSDGGIGMSAEQLEALFEPFVQGDGSTTRRFGGTGLGLAIVRRMCELLGGDIWVESQFGQGSTFHVSLPAQV